MKFVPMIALPLLLLGCQPKDEGTLQPVDSLFTEKDLAPGTVNVISAEDIAELIAAESDLWTHASATALANSSACLQEKIQNLPLKADKANVSVVAQLDAASCFSSDDLGMNVSSAPIRFAMWLGCQNKDLEELNGKTLGELGDEVDAKCAAKGEQQLLTNMEFTLYASGLVENDNGEKATSEYGFRTISATQTREGGPCILSSVGEGWLWPNDCLTINKNEVIKAELDGKSVENALTSDYVRLNFVDILESSERNAPWFLSGHFDITLNNWSGTVTYNGADQTPSWTLQNGTEVKSGILALAPLKAVKLLPRVR